MFAGLMPRRDAVSRSIARLAARPVVLLVGVDVRERRDLLKPFNSCGAQLVNSAQVAALNRVLVLRAALPAPDSKILNRL